MSQCYHAELAGIFNLLTFLDYTLPSQLITSFEIVCFSPFDKTRGAFPGV